MLSEYGVSCRVETYYPTWTNWVASFRLGRWALAHWLRREMDQSNEVYGCGPHRVVKRPTPEAPDAPR